MTYTERTFFRFPVKIYDPYDVLSAEMEENKVYRERGELNSLPVDYVSGSKLCKPKDILGVVQNYHKGQLFEDIKENGFDCIAITILEGEVTETYDCPWSLKKFTLELDEYIDKVEQYNL